LDFSTAVTGSLFFIPNAAFLDDPGKSAAPDVTRAHEPANTDPSLGIGGLTDTSGDRASDVTDPL
jgi:putative iron-dependent peroxidase